MATTTNRFFSKRLLELDSVLSKDQLVSIKLVTRFGLGLSEKQILKASTVTHIYNLIEKTYSGDSPALLVKILSSLAVPERHLFFLREKTHDIDTERLYSRLPLLDLILTLLYILDGLTEMKFYSVKTIAMSTFFPKSDPSFVKTHNDFIELLLVNNLLNVGRSLDYIFAWLETSGCSLYRQYLVRHLVDCQRLEVPNWEPLVSSMKKTLQIFGGPFERQDQLSYNMSLKEAYNCPTVVSEGKEGRGVRGSTFNGFLIKLSSKGKGDLIEYKDVNVFTRYSTNCYCFGCLLFAVALFITIGAAFFFYTFVIAKGHITI